MLNSPSKLAESPRSHKTTLKDESDPNKSDASFLSGKITSTPIRRDPRGLFSNPAAKPHVLTTPKRYNLSEIATPSRVGRRDPIRLSSSTLLNSSGPLLTSANFSVNFGTYEETKSPGLASRIVQYNEERERERNRSATHQAKYGSPGLFPVVHLFKSQPPILEQKPKRVTVKVATPEYMRHSHEYNKKLLEGIVKPTNSPSTSNRSYSLSNGEPSTSTRSVLDALKEISRKRIHASEDYDLNEIDGGKRQKTDLSLNGGDANNKRSRDDSPLLDTLPSPTSKQTSKKLCVYDEYAASCSSTDFYFDKPPPDGSDSNQTVSKRKSVSTGTLTESQKDTKQVKLINVETQTIEDNLASKKETEPPPSSQSGDLQIESSPKSLKTQESALKVFDDAPLERIRKNRLAALMGSLAGKEPVLMPKPPLSSILNGEQPPTASAEDAADKVDSAVKTPEKPLVSILTSAKKSNQKSEKHVTFNISESSESLSSLGVGTATSGTESTTVLSSKESLPTFTLNKNRLETPAPPSSPVSLQVPPVNSSEPNSQQNDNVPSTTAGSMGFQFGSGSSSVVTTTSSTSTTQISFGSAPLVPSKSQISRTPTTSPPKVGGFKFDLNKSPPALPKSTEVSQNYVPKFSFGNPTSSTTATVTNAGFSFDNKTTATTTGTFSFGTTPAVTSTSNTLTFGNKTNSDGGDSSFNKPAVDSSFVTTDKPSNISGVPTGLAFGTTTTNSSSNAPITSTAAAPTTFKFNADSSGAGGFNFGTSTSGTVPTTTATTSSFNPGTFSFGAKNVTPAPSSNTTASVPSPSFNFGTPSTTSGGTFKLPAAGNFSSGGTTNFGVNVTTTTTTTSGTSSFNMPATSNFGGFAAPTSNAPTFGSSTSSNVFPIPVPTTTTSSFGTQFNKPLPMFGTGTNATTTASGTFGNNNVSSPFASSTFGTTQPPGAFGSSTTTTTAAANFGTGFGTTAVVSQSNMFGVTQTTSNSFGGGGTNIFSGPNSGAGGFGTSTTNSIFAAGTTSSTNAGGSFNTPVFSFGAKSSSTTTSSSTFGNNSNVFGTATTTAASGMFGGATGAQSFPNSFGASNSFDGGFNTGGTVPNFGSQTNTQQQQQASGGTGFGSTTNASAFGTTPAQGGFGATNVPKSGTSIFGNANPTSNFGTPAGGFGTTPSASAFGNSTTPAFGASNPSPAFGSTTGGSAFSKPQPSNFASQNNNFGSASASVSNFTPGTANQGSMFNFGSSTNSAKPGVFSFGGGGGEIPKQGFNFNAVPAFGTGGAAAGGSFGASPGVAQFGAGGAQTMFSIGTGSPSSSKARTQLKAKRRT